MTTAVQLIQAWQEQMVAKMATYLTTALLLGDGFQVVLHMNADGSLGDVKGTILTKGIDRGKRSV